MVITRDMDEQMKKILEGLMAGQHRLVWELTTGKQDKEIEQDRLAGELKAEKPAKETGQGRLAGELKAAK